jgi:ferredoxin
MVLACAPKQPSNVFFSCELHTRECLDPFDHPECEALDVFVNEVLCVGKRCSYPCFETASHVFSCDSSGTARAMSQGHGEDYRVQSAVNQCPRNCIHYVTPSQRIILEELLDRYMLLFTLLEKLSVIVNTHLSS